MPDSSKIKNVIKKYFLVTSLIVGTMLIAWSTYYLSLDQEHGLKPEFKNLIRIFGVIWILITLAIVSIKKLRNINLMLLLSTMSTIYIGLELLTYLFIFLGLSPSRTVIEDASFGVFTDDCCKYDSISGYKWVNKPCRIAKIVNGEVVFDSRFTPNNMGYISERDYTYKKKDSSIIRYMVFGDSFTTGEYNGIPWTDRVQQIVDKHPNNRVELYNFAVDGGGLFNWYRTFFLEIVPQYEFDGIIMAIWGNDLNRDFALMHHYDTAAYFYYFDSIPKSFEDFEENYIPEMWYTADIITDKELDERIDKAKASMETHFKLARPDLHFLMKVYDKIKFWVYLKSKEGYEKKYVESRKSIIDDYDINSFAERYSPKKFAMLDSMITFCKNNDKEVILTTLADQPGVLHIKSGGGYHWMQEEVEGLARHYNVNYFDGLNIYVELSEEEIHDCFLKYDPHWSLKGSDHFAKHFAKYIATINDSVIDDGISP